MEHGRAHILLKLILISCAILQLTSCSKPVQWEEEVPLNTGEVIWVKRTVVYSAQGGAGNPFDIAYRPDKDQAIEFKWNKKTFKYKGDARIMLLAISPEMQPVLVAQADANSWNWTHQYKCTTPFYVQLTPIDNGDSWSWPPRIEEWVYNMPPNLLLSRHPPQQMKKRYSTLERVDEDYWGSVNTPWQQRIDPSYTGDLCKDKKK